MGRVDSYNANNATSQVGVQSRLGGTSRVHTIAASTQFDLSGSDAGNHGFLQDAAEANTKYHFCDGSILAGNLLAVDTVYEYELSKIVTHSGTQVVVFWK